MDNRTKWIKNRVRLGWVWLGAGVGIVLIGIFTQFTFAYLPYNFRIITGCGLFLIGIGTATLVRYKAALKSDISAQRLTIEEQDERTVFIRTRAGNRAFWVSTAYIYTGLMWSSFAANGGLPDLGGDTLWFFLAAGVLIPFGVYIVTILMEERKS